jgi:hypothetical protein
VPLITQSEAQVAYLAVRLVVLAETLGLLPRSAESGMHREQIDDALKAFARAGIGRRGAALGRQGTPEHLAMLLRDVLSAAEESPLPQYEWASLAEGLGDDLLARLVGVSVSSVHRYRNGERSTPDGTAARLHVVALITADLAGSYNDYGVRRWFQRTRTTLGGLSPADVLSADWSPDDEHVREVRALAASLLGSPAT